MDDSLASIFLNPSTTHPWPCRDDDYEKISHGDLQYKLMCASMELQSAKAAATAQGKIQEAKLCHLQELLSVIRKERDEAREECRKLQDRLLSRQATSSTESPCSFMHSSSMVSSPSSSPWSLQELEEHLNNDSFCEFVKAPTPMELQQALQSFSQSCKEEQGLQALFSIEPTCESVPEDSDQQFSLEMLDQDMPFDADPSLNLTEFEQNNEGLQGVCESTQSTRSLSRQSSSNSSSASVQMFQGVQSSRDLTEVSAPIISSVMVSGTDVVAADTPVSALVNNASLHVASSINNNGIHINVPSSPLLKPISSAPISTEGSHVMRSAPSNMQQAFAAPITASPPAQHQGNSCPLRQVHLPEPPEADPQVMLSSLPEKGKLLQAVMQAGPLLQTLLLAGPLPQWRHPPPALSTGDIPKVSMVPSNVILPYPHHMPAPLMQGHVKYNTPINNGGAAPATRVRAANADLCSRSKKLRKLSPASPHQNQYMHMQSGEGRMAVGVLHPATIF